jgi:cell division protein FtsI (penicillin-binding protein 3)
MTTRLDQQQDPQARRLLLASRFAVVTLTLALIALLGRVVQLQTHPPAPIAERTGDRLTQAPILAKRGSLLDRVGRPLAITKLGYRLFADPQMIKDPADFSADVAHAIHRDPAEIDRLLDKGEERRYVVLQPMMNDEQFDVARTLKIPGLGLEPRPIRVYPQSSVAGQLIGNVGGEDKGLDGIEFALNPVLTGRAGNLPTLRDVRRHAMWVEKTGFAPPQDGMDIRLSIDVMIQDIAEQELAKACKQYRSKQGEMIVMDSRTGQVLAMANYPFFDPSNPLLSGPESRRNRCITDPIEPGSIFKPFIHAAVTAAGIAKPSDMVDCSEGLWVTPFGRRLRDAHGHGMITWSQVLIVSSNVGMAKIGMKLGAAKMNQTIRSFGFGQHTGISLPGESAGIVQPLKRWTLYSLTSIPMGQEVGVTPMQMVKGFSAFANDGRVVTPSVLADETVTPTYQQAVPASAARLTRDLLRHVVTEGTGKKALSDKYQIWGKTGTAQVPLKGGGGYKEGAFTASFVCGAPLDEPRIIVMCTVHEPDRSIGHFGGTVSAPAAKNVVERTLTYLGIPSDVDPADVKGPKVAQVLAD